VFAYGATGAGKTFTMLGSKITPGITYLTIVELYKQMEILASEKEFELAVSHLEVSHLSLFWTLFCGSINIVMSNRLDDKSRDFSFNVNFQNDLDTPRLLSKLC
jgi:hypothetical protein